MALPNSIYSIDDDMKMTLDPKIKDLGKRLFTHLSSALTLITSTRTIKDVKIDTPYGYTIESRVTSYKIVSYGNAPQIKWGFKEDVAPWEDWTSSTPDRQMVVADRERMEKAVLDTYNNFGPYIDKLIAKILLDGFTTLMNNGDTIDFGVGIDDSCISPKGHSISHILLTPNINIAVKDG